MLIGAEGMASLVAHIPSLSSASYDLLHCMLSLRHELSGQLGSGLKRALLAPLSLGLIVSSDFNQHHISFDHG
jgi:hypothetical protein